MRDWERAFLPAAFRGVPFKVDLEEVFGARRLSVSPIAYAETSVIEDMGREPRRYPVRAYVIGDHADIAARALAAALDAPGPSTLVLPMLGTLRARVSDWSLSRDKRRNGIVAFDVTFIEAGLAAIPFPAAPAIGMLAGLIASAIAAFGSRLSGYSDGLSGPGKAAAAASGDAASSALAAVGSIVFSGGSPDSATRDLLGDLAVTGGLAATDPAAFVASHFSAARACMRLADPVAMSEIAAAEIGAAVADPAIAAMHRSALLAMHCAGLVRTTFSSRTDARRARESMAGLAAPVAAAAAKYFGEDGATLVAEITGTTALSLSRATADRGPVVRIETGVSLPAIVLAHKLYGDPSRGQELADRNRTGLAAAMPVTLEALAP